MHITCLFFPSVFTFSSIHEFSWPVEGTTSHGQCRRKEKEFSQEGGEGKKPWQIHVSYISNKLFDFRHILWKHSSGQNALLCSSPALPLPLFISSSLHLPLHYIFDTVLPVNSGKWSISVQKSLLSGCTKSSLLCDHSFLIWKDGNRGCLAVA